MTMNWRLWGTAFRKFLAELRYVDYAETASLQPARTHSEFAKGPTFCMRMRRSRQQSG